MSRTVYADNAASTPLHPLALEAMINAPCGNPDSTHEQGRKARAALEQARKTIAECINAEPEEIIFTSGATEANNLAIRAMSGSGEHPRIVTSGSEHSSVYDAVVRMFGMNNVGFVNDCTINRYGDFLSVMLANNETGAINDIADFVKTARERWSVTLAHTDATAAMGHIPVDVKALGVDYLSASAHKFGGPCGIGFLYVKNGAPVYPLMYGGGQENGKRPGTTPVPLACGMAAALKHCTDTMTETMDAVSRKRDHLAEALINLGWTVNTPQNSLPGTLSITNTEYLSSEFLPALDSLGVYCSAGSACSAGSTEPSRVLLACGFSRLEALSTIRISISEQTTAEDIKYIADTFATAMQILDSPKLN